MARKKKLDAKIEVRLPDKLAAAVRQKADRMDLPLSQVVREFLTDWVAEPIQTVQPAK